MKLFNTNAKTKAPRRAQRSVRKFAYLPTRMDAGEVVFLESYIEDQHYRFFKRKWSTYFKRRMNKVVA